MAITPQQVIEQIQKNIGSPWMFGTDICEAGKPDTVVIGIATSFTATFDVLRRAAGSGHNLIITRERPFWSHENTVMEHSGGSVGPLRTDLMKDPLFQQKSEWIANNNLVVWRLQENWDARPVDSQLQGLARALGWEKYYKPKPGATAWSRSNHAFTIPPATLLEAVQAMKPKLKCVAPRVIGDPSLRVTRAALMHGFLRVPELSSALSDPAVDLVVCGEPVEWEAGPYFMDVVASGRKIGMIILGNQVSEEPGSGEVAAWIKRVVKEVPVEWIPAGEPFRMLSEERRS
jgi:hypothetical protein